MRVRFYASFPPGWWRYHFISVRLPYRPPEASYVLLDNGAFIYYLRGVKPSIDVIMEKIRRVANNLACVAYEVAIVLPDYPFDPLYSLVSAKRARELCKDFVCYSVVHIPRGTGRHKYEDVADELAQFDWISGLAAPLKLPCTEKVVNNGRRLVVKKSCQREIVERVCSVARSKGLKCHGLGVLLDPVHIMELSKLGLTSFDSASWIFSKRDGHRGKDKLFLGILARLAMLVDIEGFSRSEAFKVLTGVLKENG